MRRLRSPLFLPGGQRRLHLLGRFRVIERLGGMLGGGERRFPIGWRRAVGRLGIERAGRLGCRGLTVANLAVSRFRVIAVVWPIRSGFLLGGSLVLGGF